jgi:cytochrome bd ubiquinol oxidase subunit II
MDRAPLPLSRLQFASTALDEAAALHSSLALMFWGAGLAGFPKLLDGVSNRVCRGKFNTTGHHY